MTKRIFRAVCAAALAVFLVSLLLIVTVLHSHFTRAQLDQLKIETDLAAHALGHEGLAYLEDMEFPDCRITWIDRDGTVLYDSKHITNPENHLEREEIREAFTSGFGESIRYSSTLTERYIYSARLLPDGTVLRLSDSQNTALTLLLGMVPPILLIVIFAVVLSLVLAYRLSRRIVRPLNALDLDDPLSNQEYAELAPLLSRINSQQCQLRAQSRELERKQHQFDTVTGSMSEGLVLLSSTAQVLSINPSAARLLKIPSQGTGKDFLSANRDPVMGRLLYQALKGKKEEQILSLDHRFYQVSASPISAGGVVSGVVILLVDVTEKQEAEDLRREFSANVSHELKTPLHAISGYAELLQAGLVQPEDIPEFSGKIRQESQRMIHLVEDILRISRLEEGGPDLHPEQTDLYALAGEVCTGLRSAADLSGISLTVTGSSCPMVSYPQLLTAIIHNLVGNAVKYNRPGGRVEISVVPTETQAVLTVRDTGIGIPEEHLSRIFERFYRVDKSHSKQVGGTGLGLSIVKHAALILNADIRVESTVNQGTCFTVTFPLS